MHPAMRSSAALALAALFGATAAPAEPGKSAQPDKPAHSATPVRERGDKGRGKADEAPAERGKADEAPAVRGKSAAAREEALGQADKDRGARDEAKGPGASDLAQTREKRRDEHRKQLHGRYGSDALQRPPIVAELKTHAWRMARLERMRTLAEALADDGKRKKTIDRVDKLIEKEKARHERQMDHLKKQDDTVAAGAGKPAGAGNGAEKPSDKSGGVQ